MVLHTWLLPPLLFPVRITLPAMLTIGWLSPLPETCAEPVTANTGVCTPPMSTTLKVIVVSG
jgi:hypothetical protein